MTRPMTHATTQILAAMARTKRFSSMRDIGAAAGIIKEPVERTSAQLRLVQRTVRRMVRSGMIVRSITSAKVDNRYQLSAPGRAIASTLYSEAVSPKPRTEQHPEPPS